MSRSCGAELVTAGQRQARCRPGSRHWLLVHSALMLVLGLASTPTQVASAAPPDAPTELDAAREQTPVLLLIADDSELGAEILRAVRIELNDVEVALERIDQDALGDEGDHSDQIDQINSATPAELLARIDASEALVRERGALGLVWLEPRSDGLTIYLVVGDGGMLRRPVLGVDDPIAAVEAAAVIIRHFTTDLLAGRPIGLTRASVADRRPAAAPSTPSTSSTSATSSTSPTRAEPSSPERSPRHAHPLPNRSYLRLQAAYIGQAWARERAWDSGAELSLGWRLRVGAHVGAGLALIPRFERTVSHPSVSGVMTYRVGRYPLSIVAGYQHVWTRPRLALDAQLRIVTELHQRRATDPIGGLSLEFGGPRLRVIPAIEPRVQLDYFPLAQLSLFVGLGLRVALIDTRYAVSYEDESGQALGETVVLQPNLVSPVVLVGVGVFL
jgi:hypothetical protein